MVKKKPAPKSQSEKAADRRARAKEARTEQAGTALLEGKPDKAKKIIEAGKKKEAKKPTAAQASEILSEAHTIEMQITGLDHKIDGVKEHYKSLKAQREVLFERLRTEIRDMGQGRLPFQSGLPSDKKPAPAPASMPSKPKDGATPPKDPIEAELEGPSAGDELDGAPDPAKDKKADDGKKPQGKAA